jgi:hypothetical protein
MARPAALGNTFIAAWEATRARRRSDTRMHMYVSCVTRETLRHPRARQHWARDRPPRARAPRDRREDEATRMRLQADAVPPWASSGARADAWSRRPRRDVRQRCSQRSLLGGAWCSASEAWTRSRRKEDAHGCGLPEAVVVRRAKGEYPGRP